MQSFQQAGQAVAEAQQGPTSAAARKHSYAKNRGRLDVMADILNCCRSPSSKSHIMLFANVNSIVATRMVASLAESGLLDSVHEEGAVVYLATSKGAGFVVKYLELQRLISPELVPAESKMNNPNRLNSLNF
ncbi:MAG TPA: winged helix-turn-helix domain-containing protein [Nitrososphaerales archaeon]|nr:winged helix-turn-helix domain-containing protein [Nitrososphaerales archaeon]